MKKRFVSLILSAALACGNIGRVSAQTTSVPIFGALGQTEESEELQTEELQTELPATAQTELQTELSDGTGGSSYPQLTAEDIVRLDGGDAEILYDDEGRVTFIRGRYSPEKVENYEDAVESLNYVASLLGLTNGALFFCVYAGIDYTTGYTYYLFLQRDGDVTIVNASIKIYVDPDGYTAALSCSFDPSTGVREETKGSISAQEAEQIVREAYPGRLIRIYSEFTGQAGVMEGGQNIHVWSVFTDNPDMSAGGSDMPYLQHFVSYSGQYLMNLPCSTTNVPLLQEDDALERKAKAMFEGYEKAQWQGEVRLHDGSTINLTIPVARSLEDGRYYLMDLDRKMLVADYREVVYGSGEYVISSSDTNSGWKDRELLAMYNIGRVYDYYADHGLYSVDGSGIPLAILSGVCNADGSAIDNAFFNGFWDGFGVFAISDINDNVECLDIMGHEFTHGITSYTMGGSAYVNDLGAINEAYSDIMGNLCELTYSINDLSIAAGKTTGQFDITGTTPYGSSDDLDPVIPDWRIGEMGGKVYRDMSDPVRYRQPAFVGDAYYCLPTTAARSTVDNDYGGVHENSSLLGNIAWVLNERGLNYERQYSLWMTAANMMTPKSDYDDILQALIFSRKTYGLEDEIDTWLEEAFAKRGLPENSHSQSGTWDGVSFVEYNADSLEVKDETPGDTLGGFLTGGTQEDAESEAQNTGGTLGGLLTGGTQTDAGDETQNAGDEPYLVQEDRAYAAAEEAGEALVGMLSGEDWLAGVGLDREGRITREGFGRIETDIAPEDMEKVAGMVILEPYTFETVGVNCPDEEGHLSLLIPEGTYWVTLCVMNYAGPSRTEYWPYTKNGSFEKMDTHTLFGEVEVKAGQSTLLG